MKRKKKEKQLELFTTVKIKLLIISSLCSYVIPEKGYHVFELTNWDQVKYVKRPPISLFKGFGSARK